MTTALLIALLLTTGIALAVVINILIGVLAGIVTIGLYGIYLDVRDVQAHAR